MILLLLLLLLLINCSSFVLCSTSSYSVVSSDLVFSSSSRKIEYYIDADIGNPSSSIMLCVDFSQSDVILFNSLYNPTTSYSSDKGGTEILKIGDKIFRVNIKIDPSSANMLRNTPCQGLLGMSRGSFIWKIWDEASFTPASVTFGKINPLFTSIFDGPDECSFTIIDCDLNPVKGSICKTSATILSPDYVTTFNGTQDENGTEITLVNKKYTVYFTSDSKSYFPDTVFYAYMNGKNVYSQNPHSWDPILMIFNETINSPMRLSKGIDNEESNIDASKCSSAFKLNIDGGDLVIYESSGNTNQEPALIFSPISEYAANGGDIDPSFINDGTIIVGLNMWSKFLIHYSHLDSTIFLKEHDIHFHSTTSNLILMVLIFTIFIRWRVSDSAVFGTGVPIKELLSYMKFDIFFQIASIALYFAAFFVPVSQRMLLEARMLYTLITLLMSVQTIGVFFVLVSDIIIVYKLYHKIVKKLTISLDTANSITTETPDYVEISETLYRLNIVKLGNHTILLLLSLLVLLLERRIEGMTSLLICTVSLILIYYLYYYQVYSLVYFQHMYADRSAEPTLQRQNKKKDNVISSFFRKHSMLKGNSFEFMGINFTCYTLLIQPVLCISYTLLINRYFVRPVFTTYVSKLDISFLNIILFIVYTSLLLLAMTVITVWLSKSIKITAKKDV